MYMHEGRDFIRVYPWNVANAQWTVGRPQSFLHKRLDMPDARNQWASVMARGSVILEFTRFWVGGAFVSSLETTAPGLSLVTVKIKCLPWAI